MLVLGPLVPLVSQRSETSVTVAIKSLTALAAKELVGTGVVFVDVRSEPEFEAGHVPGALNVPLLHKTERGLEPNSEFISVMKRAFGLGETLIIGCRSGQRSLSAAKRLEAEGFKDLSNLTPGFEGSRDAFGRPLAGWRQEGLPIESGIPSGQSYKDVKNRKPR